MSVGRHPDINGNLTLTLPGSNSGGTSFKDPQRHLYYGGSFSPEGAPPVGTGDPDAGDFTTLISLPSPGMDVELAFFYHSHSTHNSSFGFRRICNLHIRTVSSGTRVTSGPGAGAYSQVTMMRGNDARAVYSYDAPSGTFKGDEDAHNQLRFDAATGLLLEELPDGRVMAFALGLPDKESPILWAQDAQGNKHTFDYNAQGFLTALHDAVGRTVTFQYDASGTLQSLSDWVGRTVSFQYDTQKLPGQPLLTRVVGANGATEVEYDYDASGRVIAVRDAEGFQTDYTLNGRQVTQRSVQVRSVWRMYARVDLPPAPFVTNYSYTGDHLNGQTTITDALGQTTTFAIQNDTVPRIADAAGTRYARGFDSAGRETARTDANGATFQSPRNAQGAPTAVVDRAGRTTTLERDGWNNLTKITAPDGTVEQMSYTGSDDSTGQKRLLRSRTDALGQTTSYSYDARGVLLSVTDPLGHKTSWSYDTLGRLIGTTDALGNATKSTCDAAGNVLSTTDAEGNTSSATYDTGNRVKTATDALGKVTTFGYDGLGQLVQVTDALGGVRSYSYNVFGLVVSATDELGQVTSTQYDNLGRAVATLDALGHRTTMSYDVRGRLISTTVAAGELDLTTTIERDAAGQVVATVDPSGARTAYTLGATGQILSQTDALGATTSYGYDSRDQRVSTTDALGQSQRMSYDAAGRLTSVDERVDSQLRIEVVTTISSFQYDAVGRLTSQGDGAGNVTTFEYDAANRQTAVVDALGNRTTTQYDRRGLLTASVDALGHRTQIQYDVLGRVVATVDALGNQSSRTQYDALGRQVATFDALGNSTTFQYDAASRYTSQTDAKGQTTSWTYDALGRVVQTLFADGSRISYTFDAAGRQTAMQDGTGTTLTTFDAVGRETSVRYGSGHILSSVYDAVGNRTQMTDPDGGMTNYQYDLLGHLTQLTNPQGETTLFQYNRRDQVVQKTLANGVVETHEFDATGRETNIEYRNSAGTTLASFASTYDVAGRKTGVSEADGSAMSYSYDASGQLLSEARTGTNPYSIAYTYDALGNRLTKTDNGVQTRSTYDAANQLLSEQTPQSSASYTYDLNGNLIQKADGAQTTSFGWNSQNFLVSVTNPDGTSENYTYCGDGIRRTKTSSEGFRRFIRDGQNILLEVADTGGTLRRYTHQSDGWGTLLSLRQGNTSRYYGFDGSANTRVLTDEGGNTSDAYLYSAFGEELQVSGTSGNPLRFGGEMGYYNDEPGRLYVRARHLDVKTGRWVSRDPIGFADGQNVYKYVANAPTTKADPTGLAWVEIRWIHVAIWGYHSFILVWDTNAQGQKVGPAYYAGGYQGNGFTPPVFDGPEPPLTSLWGMYYGDPKRALGCPDYNPGEFPGGSRYGGSLVVLKDNKPLLNYLRRFNRVSVAMNSLGLSYPWIADGPNSNSMARTYLQVGLGIDITPRLQARLTNMWQVLPGWQYIMLPRPYDAQTSSGPGEVSVY